MPYFLPILFIILAYFIGSVSTAIVSCKILGKADPRTVGSKNPGATNVLRYAGKKAAFLTLMGDVLKGLLPVVIGHLFGLDWGWLVAIGIAAFLGHIYPLYYGFKGGKGVATAIGLYFGLHPLVGVIIGLSWLVAALVFNISSLSALVATLLAPLYFYLVTDSLPLFLGLCFMTIMIYWRHRSNIAKIFDGTEGKISEKSS